MMLSLLHIYAPFLPGVFLTGFVLFCIDKYTKLPLFCQAFLLIYLQRTFTYMKRILLLLLLLPAIAWGQTQSVTMQFSAPTSSTALDSIGYTTVPARTGGKAYFWNTKKLRQYFKSQAAFNYSLDSLKNSGSFIKNQFYDYGPDSTQSGGFNLSQAGVFYSGVSRASISGTQIDLSNGNDSDPRIAFQSDNVWMTDSAGTVSVFKISRFVSDDSVRVTGKYPVVFNQAVATKHTPVNQYDVVRLKDLPGGGIGLSYSKSQTDSIAALKAQKDSAETHNTNLYYLQDKSKARSNLGVPYATASVNSTAAIWYGWGDSLTAGLVGQLSYPYQLSQISGETVINKGIGGQTSTQILSRFNTDTASHKYPTIIWIGRNNYASPTTVKSDIASLVSGLGANAKYIVLSIPNSNTTSEWNTGGNYPTITTLNSDLATIYGARYFDIRAYMVAQYNPLNAQDVIDHGHDVPPTSLRIDSLHYNTAGNAIIAQKILSLVSLLQNSSDSVLTQKNARGYFVNRKQIDLGIGGKYAIGGVSVAYMPDQSIYPGNLSYGSIPANLSHTTGTEGYYNTFSGIQAGQANTTGYYNTFGGYVSGNATTTGYSLTGIGAGTLLTNTTGYENTAIGKFSLVANTTGFQNTGIGVSSFNSLTTGSLNTAIGTTSQFSNISGTQNTSVGSGSLYYNTGNNNTAFGVSAFYNNKTGSGNVVIGRVAGEGVFNSSNLTNNTFIGFSSGRMALTGADNNTFIGANSGSIASLTASRSVIIGADINPQSLSASGQLSIANAIFGTGNMTTGTTVGAGNIGIYVTAPTARLHLPAGTASAGTAPFKYTSGALTTTPTDGQKEYDGTDEYLSVSSNRYVSFHGLKGTATLDFPSTVSGAVSDLTITVTGAALGDAVAIGVPNASVTATGRFSAWVSATNTVTVRYVTSATEDPASGTFKATIIK